MTDVSAGRLRWILVADGVLAIVAGAFTVAMSLTVARIGWLFAVGCFVAAIGGVILCGLVPLRRGRVEGALWVLSGANWTVSVVAAAIATFAWPLLMVSALFPSVVAASFAPLGRLWRFVAPSFVVALAVTAVGTLQDATGLSDEVPEWLLTAILICTAPGFGGVLVTVALQHHKNLMRALDEERQVRRALDVQAEQLRESRQRVVAATDRARRRIEQDLHDGAQSRLVGINLQLAAAKAKLADAPADVRATLDDVSREVRHAHTELRDLAHGLYPTVLTQHGLVAAVEAAADRIDAPVKLDLHRIGRVAPDVEAAVYFCILEALQNASRHADASRVDVRLERDECSITFTVADDGLGFDTSVTGGHGLTNLHDRLGAMGGSVEIGSTKGVGTRIVGAIPVATRTGEP